QPGTGVTSGTSVPPRLQPFDDGDVGGAAALAHRLQAVAAASSLQLVEHGGEKLCPRCAQRMTECDRATVGVDLLGVGLDLLEPGQHDGRERLVDLYGVDVVNRQPGLLECVAVGRDRSGEHEYRVRGAGVDGMDTRP